MGLMIILPQEERNVQGEWNICSGIYLALVCFVVTQNGLYAILTIRRTTLACDKTGRWIRRMVLFLWSIEIAKRQTATLGLY